MNVKKKQNELDTGKLSLVAMYVSYHMPRGFIVIKNFKAKYYWLYKKILTPDPNLSLTIIKFKSFS